MFLIFEERMKKVFDLGALYTSKRRMVEGDVVKQINDYPIHLSTLRQEIDRVAETECEQ